MPTDLLFAYGTLRTDACPAHAEASAIRRELFAHARGLGPARARGWLFLIDWYPGFVPDPAGIWVRGELFDMTDAAHLWPMLDIYEGTQDGDGAPGEYARRWIMADAQAGSVRARTYVYIGRGAGLPVIADGDFVRASLSRPAI